MKYVLEQNTPDDVENLITDDVISLYRDLLRRYRSGEYSECGWNISIETRLISDCHLHPRVAFLLGYFRTKEDLKGKA